MLVLQVWKATVIAIARHFMMSAWHLAQCQSSKVHLWKKSMNSSVPRCQLKSCLNAGCGEMPALPSCQLSKKRWTIKMSQKCWNMCYHLLWISKWCGNTAQANKHTVSPIDCFWLRSFLLFVFLFHSRFLPTCSSNSNLQSVTVFPLTWLHTLYLLQHWPCTFRNLIKNQEPFQGQLT